jgi:glutathione S-transferase
MTLTLYYGPNTCALVPYVALTEAGAAFEVRPLNFRQGEHRAPAYLALNPMHKVPVLLVDGQPLTENVAIQIWIARNFPEAGLLPSDPWQAAKAIALLAWCAADLHPHLSRHNSPTKYCDAPGVEEPMRRIAAHMLRENFQIADGLLAGRDYFFDRFSSADAYFFWCFRRATQFGLDLTPHSHCLAHFARMQERPSVRKLLAYEREVQSAFAH